MLTTIYSLLALFSSFTMLIVGHGFFNTLLALQAHGHGFSEFEIGMMMSGYYVGFMLGARFLSPYIRSVGHIRIFAALATLISATVLAHALTHHFIVWTALRMLYGVALVGLYMVIESWLNGLAEKENRGKILSVYMTLSFLGFAVSQLVVSITDMNRTEPFLLTSIVISLCLMPVLLSQSKPPVEMESDYLSMRKIFRLSPLATFGVFSYGVVNGSFWGLVSIFLKNNGLPDSSIGLFISAYFCGAFAFQYPSGYISDRFSRYTAILINATGFVLVLIATLLHPESLWLWLVVAFLWGGFLQPLYSLFIALANDFVRPSQALSASATLLQFNGIGAAIGPFAVGLAMEFGGNNMFVYISLLTAAAVLAMTIHQRLTTTNRHDRPRRPFLPMPRSFALPILKLDRRMKRD